MVKKSGINILTISGTIISLLWSFKSFALLNGKKVDSSKNPEVILIKTVGDSGKYMICSGAFIGPNTIITAAHCLYRPGGGKKNISVHVNDQPVSVKSYKIHPEYVKIAKKGSPNSVNDIGIIILNHNLAKKYANLAQRAPSKNEKYTALSLGPTDKNSNELGELNTACSDESILDMGVISFATAMYELGIATIKGDSGSILLDSKGKLVGISSGSSPEIPFKGRKAILSSYSAIHESSNHAFIKSSLRFGAKIPSLSSND